MAEESDLVKNHSLLASMLNSANSVASSTIATEKREHASDSSDAGENDDNEKESSNNKAKKARKEKKKGQRKNIRKIIGEEQLDEKTLQARKEEIERVKKAEER